MGIWMIEVYQRGDKVSIWMPCSAFSWYFTKERAEAAIIGFNKRNYRVREYVPKIAEVK